MVVYKKPLSLKKSSKDLGISKKISLMRSHFGLSADAMGEKAGVSGTAIANIERGDSLNPGAEMLSNISTMLGVNLNWLLLGEGEMLKSADPPKKISVSGDVLISDVNAGGVAGGFGKFSLLKPARPLSSLRTEEPPTPAFHQTKVTYLQPTVNEEGKPNIGLVSTRVAAGYVQHLAEPEFVRQLPAFSLPDKAFKNGTFRCFVVQGDSMQPTLYAGDWVICRVLDDWTRDIRDSFVHVVVTDEQPLVKRVLNRLNERGQLSMLSDNPAYPTQFVDGAEVRELWVAVGKLSRHFENPRYDVATELSRTRADVDELLAFMLEVKGELASEVKGGTKARK